MTNGAGSRGNSQLEDKTLEIIHLKERRWWENKQIFCGNMTKNLTFMPLEWKEMGGERVELKTYLIENFPNLARDINIQIQAEQNSQAK